MRPILATLIAAAAVLGPIPVIGPATAGEPAKACAKVVRIGVAESLYRDIDPQVLLALIPPFRMLAKSCSGIDCDLRDGGDAFRMAERLKRGQLELGIFQGIEFAWVRQKHPELRPLMTAVNGKPYLRAILVVPASSQATCLADLKGRSLAISRYSLDDCYEFLAKLCRQEGLSPQQFVSHLLQPPDAEEALDQVVDGTVAAAIVEEVSLDCYRRRQPGRFQRLKTVQESERFPVTVVAYRAGSLSDETLRVFREGMCRAHRAPDNRHLLTWWRISGFEEVPADFQDRLDEIAKTYPTRVIGSSSLTLRSLLEKADRFLGQQSSSPPPDDQSDSPMK